MDIAFFGAQVADAKTIDTPFGPAACTVATLSGRTVGFFGRKSDPRARVYAAKALGAARVVGLFNGVALNRLLRPGDWLVADDAIDQTRGGPTTFFVNRGLGFVQMTPPFCPETRAALAASIRSLASDPNAHCFDLGVAVACPPRPITPAESKAWRALGGDVAVWGLAPEWSLARELELCYAALVAIGDTPGIATRLEPLLTALPVERRCGCPALNPGAHRELGDDWREWVK